MLLYYYIGSLEFSGGDTDLYQPVGNLDVVIHLIHLHEHMSVILKIDKTLQRCQYNNNNNNPTTNRQKTLPTSLPPLHPTKTRQIPSPLAGATPTRLGTNSSPQATEQQPHQKVNSPTNRSNPLNLQGPGVWQADPRHV